VPLVRFYRAVTSSIKDIFIFLCLIELLAVVTVYVLDFVKEGGMKENQKAPNILK